MLHLAKQIGTTSLEGDVRVHHQYRAEVASPVLRYIKVSYRLLEKIFRDENEIENLMSNFKSSIQLIHEQGSKVDEKFKAKVLELLKSETNENEPVGNRQENPEKKDESRIHPKKEDGKHKIQELSLKKDSIVNTVVQRKKKFINQSTSLQNVRLTNKYLKQTQVAEEEKQQKGDQSCSNSDEEPEEKNSF